MIYIVSGWPRSGTSMMMQACEAGGMEVVRSKQRDVFNAAHSDSNYKPNPESLYEPAMKDVRNPQWWKSQAGKVVKCVAPWLKYLPVSEYSVVFMLRDPEEIRQSFEASWLQRGANEMVNSDTTYVAPYGTRLSLPTDVLRSKIYDALDELANRRDVQNVLALNYRWDVLENPSKAFEKVAKYWPIDPVRAAAVVDRECYRFRMERLTIGA